MAKKEEEPGFEERMARLEAITALLEKGEATLEASVTLYKEGLVHLAACETQLATAKHGITMLTQEGTVVPFVEKTPSLSSREDA